jgi:hypothetical protein
VCCAHREGRAGGPDEAEDEDPPGLGRPPLLLRPSAGLVFVPLRRGHLLWSADFSYLPIRARHRGPREARLMLPGSIPSAAAVEFSAGFCWVAASGERRPRQGGGGGGRFGVGLVGGAGGDGRGRDETNWSPSRSRLMAWPRVG